MTTKFTNPSPDYDGMIYGLTEHNRPGTKLEDVVGFIPDFMSRHDDRPAAEQIADSYIGGWRPQKGFKFDPKDCSVKFPGDPKMLPLAVTWLRDEKIFIYFYGYVAVVQPDGAFAVSRLD